MPTYQCHSNVGNYSLVGDYNGKISIQSAVFTPVAATAGNPATGSIELTFDAPLPDEYGATILESAIFGFVLIGAFPRLVESVGRGEQEQQQAGEMK